MELECALRHVPAVNIVPVLLAEDCVFSGETVLPESLEPLRKINGTLLRPGAEFEDDMRRLRDAIAMSVWPNPLKRMPKVVSRMGVPVGDLLASLTCAALVTFALRDSIGSALIGSEGGVVTAARRIDPHVFEAPTGTERFELARVLPDRLSLTSESSLEAAIAGATKSFDAFVLTGNAIANRDDAILKALRKGVRVRRLIVDHSDANAANVEAYLNGGIVSTDGDLLESRAKYDFVMRWLAAINRAMSKEKKAGSRSEDLARSIREQHLGARRRSAFQPRRAHRGRLLW